MVSLQPDLNILSPVQTQQLSAPGRLNGSQSRSGRHISCQKARAGRDVILCVYTRQRQRMTGRRGRERRLLGGCWSQMLLETVFDVVPLFLFHF